MASLVEQLQQEALDHGASVTVLLRKSLVVASKLNLRKFKKWVDLELKGYAGVKVPDYRMISGSVKLWNPFNGWIPLIMAPDLEEKINPYPINTPIGTLEDFLSKPGKDVIFSFAPQLRHALMRGLDYPLEPSFHSSRSALVLIVDYVRDVVLRWSLDLEKDGIVGEGMTFSAHERQIAKVKADELQTQISIVVAGGDIKESALQQGSPGAEQD